MFWHLALIRAFVWKVSSPIWYGICGFPMDYPLYRKLFPSHLWWLSFAMRMAAVAGSIDPMHSLGLSCVLVRTTELQRRCVRQ